MSLLGNGTELIFGTATRVSRTFVLTFILANFKKKMTAFLSELFIVIFLSDI